MIGRSYYRYLSKITTLTLALVPIHSVLSMSTATIVNELVMDPFGIRQFNNPSYLGTQVNYDVQEFENKVNEYYRSGEHPLVEGYAPFW